MQIIKFKSILVATEGINGTLSGTVEETEKYMEAMQADERFKDTFFKIDPAEEMAFRKMFVRPRSELVALNLEEDVDPLETTGNIWNLQNLKMPY